MNAREPRLNLAAAVVTAVVAYLVAGCSGGNQRVVLADHVFLIPKEYSLGDSIPLWLRLMPGLDDDSRATLFQVPAEELAVAVPGYIPADGKYVENVRAMLTVLAKVEAERYVNPEWVREAREGTGSFSGRIVEPYVGQPWYKVFRPVEYPYSWSIFSMQSSSDEFLSDRGEDRWLAHCLRISSPIATSGNFVSCSTHVLFEDLVIEFSISEQNLVVADEIKLYLVSKVTSWKQE